MEKQSSLPMVQLEVIFLRFGLWRSSSSSRFVGSHVENFSPTPEDRKHTIHCVFICWKYVLYIVII